MSSEQETHDVVVLATYGLCCAVSPLPDANDIDRVALEANLAHNILSVQVEKVQKGGTSGGVGLLMRVVVSR